MKDLTKLDKRTNREFDVKRVIFHDIEVREYPQILGDNPGVSEGEDKQALCFPFVLFLSAALPHFDFHL